jgi:Fungalysin/Thermolysin Propeptide Motif
LTLIRTKTSLLGKHYWYQQNFKGLPVIGGYYAKHIEAGKLLQVADGRDAVPEQDPLTPVQLTLATVGAWPGALRTSLT